MQRLTVAYMLSGEKVPWMVLLTLASRQKVHTAMKGMYRSHAFTSCRGGRYLCPPVICAISTASCIFNHQAGSLHVGASSAHTGIGMQVL